ncbi:hypothetical protein [Streptomyces sp. PpalLS-921]|uniref:hypothetical protein n=1 Tax=Streptomyces sp. PpalLS-921 TaxID=1839772 RepID=UPI00081F448A|nr:hypothetical protein [Streptomyces sp. PpalLS-921]SCD61665.1 hypothetical protein GA0115249_106348 [Streptomyces sp. PpalLS-921]
MTTTPTPADELRAAARELRKLATAASTDQAGRPTSRWAVRYQPGVLPGAPPQTDRPCYLKAVDEADPDGRGARPLLHGNRGSRGRPPSMDPQHAEYAAAMDPGVGLALADWLDAAAVAHDATVTGATGVWTDPADTAERDAWVTRQTDQHALVVARRILGDDETVGR